MLLLMVEMVFSGLDEEWTNSALGKSRLRDAVIGYLLTLSCHHVHPRTYRTLLRFLHILISSYQILSFLCQTLFLNTPPSPSEPSTRRHFEPTTNVRPSDRGGATSTSLLSYT